MNTFIVEIPVTGVHRLKVKAETADIARQKAIYRSQWAEDITDIGPALDYNWLYMRIDGKYLSKEDDYS